MKVDLDGADLHQSRKNKLNGATEKNMKQINQQQD